MAPMHLAAAEAGGTSGKAIFAQETGVVRAQRSEPRPLQKSALRRAGGWPLSLVMSPGTSVTKMTAQRWSAPLSDRLCGEWRRRLSRFGAVRLRTGAR